MQTLSSSTALQPCRSWSTILTLASGRWRITSPASPPNTGPKHLTYLSWSAVSTDGKKRRVERLLDVDANVAVNDAAQPVTWSRARASQLTLLNVGSRDQQTLHQSGDRMRIDWGYFH